jgi:hypothetical protein
MPEEVVVLEMFANEIEATMAQEVLQEAGLRSLRIQR